MTDKFGVYCTVVCSVLILRPNLKKIKVVQFPVKAQTLLSFSRNHPSFCIRSEELSLGQFLAGQIVLSTLLPYVLPFLGLTYPLYSLSRRLLEMEDGVEGVRHVVRNAVIVAGTHVLLRSARCDP